MIINARELATILAALRYWQDKGLNDLLSETDHFQEHASLDSEEIDDLCEHLNCGWDPIEEALEHQAEAFDNDEEVNGADLVEWFAEWRRRIRDALE